MNAAPQAQPADPFPETPPLAAAEARAAVPLQVSGIEGVVRPRLLTATTDALRVHVLAKMHRRGVSSVLLLNADRQEEALLRKDVMGVGCQ